jgi:opine dehydrogenase
VISAVDAERLAVARTLGVPAKTFLETFFEAGLTTAGALASGSVAQACRESGPNRTIKSPPSLNHRYLHEDVGYGLVPMAELADLAGVPTPTIDSLIHLASTAQGLDYRRDGLTLERLGLQGLTVEALLRVVREGV